ncbi:DnaJ-like protein subfamily C member 9 [Dirofilaria immitis]|nr:DnaJ-like protein subfamily C member 9 [Dirofilaria immitis]
MVNTVKQKLSLQFHPDRCDDDTKKVQTTRVIDDAEISSDDVDWLAKWRLIFKKITKEDIDNFIQKFRDSGEERDAVKEAYIKNKGDLGKILNDVIGVTYEDEERLRRMISGMIESGELKATRYFISEPEKRKARRRKAAEREAKEAEELLKEVQKNEGKKDLVALIRNRQQKNLTSFNQFCDSLAVKYAKKPRKTK